MFVYGLQAYLGYIFLPSASLKFQGLNIHYHDLKKDSEMITVVVPIHNEEDNIKPLIKEIFDAAKVVPISEVIYVDDASTDSSWAVLKALRPQYPPLRMIKHNKNAGQSAALWTGIKAAGNDLIVTLDGDGQNPPADIKLLWETYSKHKDHTSQLAVMGERAKRNDNLIRRFSSRFANGLRAKLLHDQTKDTGCSLKLFHRKDYLRLPYFDHMHRFLPALLLRDGVKLFHVNVSHRPRLTGQSKYGTLDRALVGLSDIRGVLWLQKRARRAFEQDMYEELN